MIPAPLTVRPIADGSPEGVRDARGRFVTGNPGGPGNPHGRRVQELRAALLSAVSDDDLRAIVGALVAEAKSGNVQAARELLDRLIGRPAAEAVPDDAQGGGFVVVIKRDDDETPRRLG